MSNQGPSGIYAITNTENGKAYIGSTINLKQRWGRHRTCLRQGDHWNAHLQCAWDKYGEAAFEFTVCEYVENARKNEERLRTREQYWLNFYRMYSEVYNIGMTVDRPTLGISPSEETRAKISMTGLGRKHPPRTTAMREAMAVRASGTEYAAKPYPAWLNVDTDERIPAGTNFAAMCRERGLCETAMRRVMYGRAQQHKGWVIDTPGAKANLGALRRAQYQQRAKKNGRPYPELIHRDTGQILPAGSNLNALCREHGLLRSNVALVVAGKQGHHRGWMLNI